LIEKNTQESGDKAVLKKCDQIKETAKAYRDQFESAKDGWEQYEKFYYGDQWQFSEKRPVKNWCFTIIEGEVPVITDIGKSFVDLVPLEQQHEAEAKVLEASVQSVFETQKLILKVSQSIRSALVTGTAWQYVDYDPDLDQGDGNVVIKCLPWRHVWIDPTATEIDEADYAIIEIPTSVDELKRRFPKSANDIKPNKEQETFNKRASGTDSDRWSPGMVTEQSVGRFKADDLATVEEYWIKDYTMEPIPEDVTALELEEEAKAFLSGKNPDVNKYMNHKGHMLGHANQVRELAAELLQLPVEVITEQDIAELETNPKVGVGLKIVKDHLRMHKILDEQNPKGTRPKYPENLRLIIKIDKTILYDGQSPERDGKIPLVPFYAYKTEDSIYGLGEVKNLISAQKSFNEMDWAELQGLRLNGNSGWVIDKESGIDSDTLTNEPGIIITKKQGTEARRLEPGVVSPQLATRKFADQQAMEQISGINEASQGRKPSSVTAAAAIQALQGATRSRINQKQRYLSEYSLPRLASLVASRIVNRWSVEKKLRVYDKDGELQYIEYNPDEIYKLKYDIRPLASTNSGLAKEEVFSVMSQLLQGNAIDPRTFVELTDLPYRSAVLKRMDENDEKNAMIEQLVAENAQLKEQGNPQSLQDIPADGEPPTEAELIQLQNG